VEVREYAAAAYGAFIALVHERERAAEDDYYREAVQEVRESERVATRGGRERNSRPLFLLFFLVRRASYSVRAFLLRLPCARCVCCANETTGGPSL